MELSIDFLKKLKIELIYNPAISLLDSHPKEPGDSISRRLSRLSLPWDLHPDSGTPGSQVATVLGRMNLHHIYSRPQWAN